MKLLQPQPNDAQEILGFPVTRLSGEECIGRIAAWVMDGKRSRYAVCANPHSIEKAMEDRLFADALLSADMVLPDGVGMIVASRLLGGDIRRRITGTDLFLGVCAAMNRTGGCRIFFLGSTQQNLDQIVRKMKEDFPHIHVAGTFSPPFKDRFSSLETEQMIRAVNDASADILWVGMTAPKQEKWIHENRDRLNVKLIGAIGAVFDFYTGNVKRSHPAFQRMGLEWLPRLLRQPRRLYERTMISAPKFLFHVIQCRLGNRRQNRRGL